ncbi:50S ribosomal protein L6 [candidate division KSB1 bacterium]|nr:50S ribosomal protein L6 [candidate division KSB1 bacterium]
MSRVGKRPINLPEGVKVELANSIITISKGSNVLTQKIHPDISVDVDSDTKEIQVSRPTDNKLHRSLHGLYRALISNMVVGVTNGFTKRLEIVGVGHRAELRGKSLFLNIGYSHPILFKVPDEVEIKLESPTVISVKGIDKQLVGQIAAKIRSFKPPEPYKGKGIRYSGEYVRRKAGKTAGK